MHSFQEIYGHESAVQNLKQALLAGRTPHAVIISGQAGAGKKLLAGCLAKAMQCQGRGPQEADSCGGCVSCRTFESGNHPDVFRVKATKTKGVSVDDVRERIVSHMAVRPYQYPHKIFIVERADTMSAGAQNALLKTIEEPSGFGVFMLLCENPGALLPTVKSRCALFKLKPLPQALVLRYLTEKAGIAAREAGPLAVHAAGSIGRALALAQDEEFSAMRGHMFSIAASIDHEPTASLFSRAKELEGYKDRISEALDILHLWYRDLAVRKATNGAALLTQKDKLDDIEKNAAELSLRRILKNCDAVAHAKRQLAHYGHFQLVMETLLLTLKET